MKYEIIYPLGKREGFGSYETFFPKGMTRKEAFDKNDYVIVDFVQDRAGLIHFRAYHIQRPEYVLIEILAVQKFPCGIDLYDDRLASYMAKSLLNKTA